MNKNTNCYQQTKTFPSSAKAIHMTNQTINDDGVLRRLSEPPAYAAPGNWWIPAIAPMVKQPLRANGAGFSKENLVLYHKQPGNEPENAQES